MSRNNLEVFFHMINHYKKLEAVKCVVDSRRSRQDQHKSKGGALKCFRKKKRNGKEGKTRALSDPRPQTRRNLSDVLSAEQTRSRSTKGLSFKSSKKKNKEVPHETGLSPLDQTIITVEPDQTEPGILNNVENENHKEEEIQSVFVETTSIFPKAEADDVEVDTTSNFTVCTENAEEKSYCGHVNKCLNEHEYSQFLLRITEDIIRNEYYTGDMILNVFKSHIEANKSHLDLDKMLLMIKRLCSEINFPIEFKKIDECDINEQCGVCFDYSNENLNSAALEREQQQEKIFDNYETSGFVTETKSLDVPVCVDQTKTLESSLTEKLKRCSEKDEDRLPEIKKRTEDISQSLKFKNEENVIMADDLKKRKAECEPEKKWNKDENVLPTYYVNQLEDHLRQMETVLTQITQANLGQSQNPEISGPPQSPPLLHYPDKCNENNLYQREQHHETCNMTGTPTKHYCRLCQMRFRERLINKNDELPATYPFGLSYDFNRRHLKNDVGSKEVTFCNMSSMFSSEIDCNTYPEEGVEVIKLPPKVFVEEESYLGNNSRNLSSSNNTTSTYDSPLDTNRINVSECTEIINETKTAPKEKNQPIQRAAGVQWGKCYCLNNKGTQTHNSFVTKKYSPSKIVQKSIDVSTQFAKTERGCPSSSEYYKQKKAAKELSEKVDVYIQYEKGADENKKSKADPAKDDVEENLNSRKEQFKVCIQPTENTAWNSKIIEYKSVLQDLFNKCENNNTGPEKESMGTKFNASKNNSESGTMSDIDCYQINQYKSILQDLFQRCNVITPDQDPTGKVNQATNATPTLVLQNYEIKACQKNTDTTISSTAKEKEIFISPIYEKWTVSSKDSKFGREIAHQHPQVQGDFHINVMHDAYTSMPDKQSPYCNTINPVCTKRDNFLLGSTYENNIHKESTFLPSALAAFFPNAETQTTDIDRHLAARQLMSIQAPTKEDIPKKMNQNTPQDVEEEKVSQKKETEMENTTAEEPSNLTTKQKRGSLKPESKGKKRDSLQLNRMVSVGNIEEVPFAYENNVKGYHSDTLHVESILEEDDKHSVKESNDGPKALNEENGESTEIEVKNIIEEDDVNDLDSLELMERKGRKPRKSSGENRSKQNSIELTEKQDEPNLSDESEYNCCGRKKIPLSEMVWRNERSSTRGSTWSADKHTHSTDVNASQKNADLQRTTRVADSQDELQNSDKRLSNKSVNMEQIKKRFGRRNSSLNSDDVRLEQTVRKTLGEKVKERPRSKSHYFDEDNIEFIRTRSKKRNTLMALQDEVSIDS